MAHLSVNIDYIAVIRESRKTVEPDPVYAAGIAELAGAQGITVHLREDRRHIQDRDVRMLRDVVRLPFNLEMAATDEMLAIAADIRPDLATFVPEKRQEVTTEGGLDVAGNSDRLADAVYRMKEAGIAVSMFIDPEHEQIERSRDIGASCVELHTGEYANATGSENTLRHLAQIADAASFAADLGLEVHAGHGLTYRNIRPVAAVGIIEGFYIGHSIMSRAVFVGLEMAVKDMLSLINGERG